MIRWHLFSALEVLRDALYKSTSTTTTITTHIFVDSRTVIDDVTKYSRSRMEYLVSAYSILMHLLHSKFLEKNCSFINGFQYD